MKSQLACVLRITDVGTRMTNCDVINIKNTIMTSEGTILLHLLESGIREIKRSPDTMKAAAILVCSGFVGLQPTVIASRAPHLLLEQSVKIQRIVDVHRPSIVDCLVFSSSTCLQQKSQK